MNFKTLGINQAIIDGLAVENISEATPAQELAIPLILDGRDLVLQSQTGTGKTLAYLLPIYEQHSGTTEKGAQAIVLVPTKELAMQVHRQVESLSQNSGCGLKSMVIFGDVNIKGQIERLREKPQIIIGTCDRIIELIKKKKIPAHTVKTLVIDEADKMLDKDNVDGVKEVRKTLMRDTQIVMMSASIADRTLHQAKEISKDPQLVKTTDTLSVPENIKHFYIIAESRDKLDVLRKLIGILKPQRSIIFINKQEEIELACEKLRYHKLDAKCIHGANLKEERKKTLSDFASGALQFLVATDIASRGLHIDGVSNIFSLSISEEPMDYLHRCGRAGRNSNEGSSISIVSGRELPLMKKYQNKLNITMTEIKMHEGKIIEKKA